MYFIELVSVWSSFPSWRELIIFIGRKKRGWSLIQATEQTHDKTKTIIDLDLFLNYFHGAWSALWDAVRVGYIWSCRILFAFKNANVCICGRFCFPHLCCILSMTPWDHGSCSKWRKGCVHVTVSCKVEAPSPGSCIFIVHQLYSALDTFWICFLCSEQMASPRPHQLPCMPDVSRIHHTCYACELHMYSDGFI